jgi:hypothetical protein
MARVAEAEGDDPLLEVGTDRVRHPRPPALAYAQSVDPPAIELLLQRQ